MEFENPLRHEKVDCNKCKKRIDCHEARYHCPTDKENYHIDCAKAVKKCTTGHELEIKALEKHRGRRKNAAQELGISERTLYRKIKEYDIQ